MARNVEITAWVSDPKAMRSRVESLGATGPEQLMQTDTFFNVPVGRLKLREFGDREGRVNTPLAFAPDGKTILALGSHGPRLWDPQTGKPIRTLEPYGPAAVVEHEGRYLITQRRPTAVLPLMWEFPGGRVKGPASVRRMSSVPPRRVPSSHSRSRSAF